MNWHIIPRTNKEYEKLKSGKTKFGWVDYSFGDTIFFLNQENENSLEFPNKR